MTINGQPAASGFDNTVAQAANTVLAGPTSGSSAAPTMRLLVVADVPAFVRATNTLFLTSNAL